MIRTTITGVLAIAGALLFLASGVFASGAPEEPATLTVLGEGELVVEPDQAVVTLGVQLYDESAQRAAADLRERMDAVIEAIHELGVPEGQIQTANYSVFFERDYQTPLTSRSQEGDPVGIYRVENMVRVTITDVALAASVVDAAIESGANQMYGVEFSLSSPGSYDTEARLMAVANARARAEGLAEAVDRTVGRALEVTEIVGGSPLPYNSRVLAEGMGGGPIQPGGITYSARVQVTYELE
ncbi:MAG: SIMPL domain-containing protein [Spirochaetaceae bacterium]